MIVRVDLLQELWNCAKRVCMLVSSSCWQILKVGGFPFASKIYEFRAIAEFLPVVP